MNLHDDDTDQYTLAECVNDYARAHAYAALADGTDCPCHEGGWILNPYDFWQKCPCHFRGQTHPEMQASVDTDMTEGLSVETLARVESCERSEINF